MRKKRKGFTLIELIAVVAIIALILLIAIPAYNSIRKRTLQKQYENLVTLIETKAEQFASVNGTNLTNVEELVNAGFLETDDGTKVLDPRDKSDMSCFLVEITYSKGKYSAKYTNKASYVEGSKTECDLAKAKLAAGNINILMKDIKTNKDYYTTDGWIRATEGLELSIDRTNMPTDEVISQYKWVSGSGQTGNTDKLIVKTETILNTGINLEVTTKNDLKYFASTNVYIDVEGPVIEDVIISGGNNWEKGRDVKVKASDKAGSGIAGYYVGQTPCDEKTVFVDSEENEYTAKLTSEEIFDLEEEKDYYVCVKDKVGIITKYDQILKISIKDKVKPKCVWEGESTKWTNVNRIISLKCSDNESGCDPQYSSYSNEYTVNTKTDTLSYILKDRAGNETKCEKEVNVYFDNTNPDVPTLESSSRGNWVKNKVVITASSKDTISGVGSWSWSTDQKTWSTEGVESSGNTATITFTSEFNNRVYIRACDKAGNCVQNYTMVKIDKTPPDIPTLDNSSDERWTNQNITVIATSSDSGSGIGTWYWSYDAKNWSDEDIDSFDNEASFVYTAERNQSTYIKICDNVGNCSQNDTMIKIDKTAPNAPTNMEFVYGDWRRYTQGDWAYQSIFAGSTSTAPAPSGAADNAGGSGISHYQISSDGTTWYNYSYDYTNSMYKMSSEGTHYRYFRAVDNAGNVSSAINRSAKIDLCQETTSSTGNWSTCSAACGSGIQSQVTTYYGISGRTCDTSTATKNCFLKSCTPTVTVTGNITNWICGKCRNDTNTTYCAKDNSDSCIDPLGSYTSGNTVGKVSYTADNNKVTFNWKIIQGGQTYINKGYWVKFIIKNSTSTIYSAYLKTASGEKWSKGSTHTGSITYTFNTKGTYYIYIDGNSNNPNFDMNFGTITIS